ncbi:MAG: hypothetical protein P4L84_23190 [Isosphaeraceae bacterium]|nr:hypothetical protein [Isosphaeraceae bacterium]
MDNLTSLPALPLLLWDTPPGLEQVLAQEGIAYFKVRDSNPLAFRAGRFVLYDGRRVSPAARRATLSPEHVAVDVQRLHEDTRFDPFEALTRVRSHRASWNVSGRTLTEHVARYDRGTIRRKLVHRLRLAIQHEGGLWARLAPYPYPYRSAFNFRVDLDEPAPDDYRRFARARRRVEDCCTHFVSTRAYGDQRAVLDDLRRFDTQSHGHHHVIYRDPAANRRNLERAHDVLVQAGFTPGGFAAPHGRWNAGLDAALEDLGYQYSSDFQLAHDDFPFSPWRSDERRFSRVLQVPIHPVCEGLFLDTGPTPGRVIAEYLAAVVRSKVAAGETAFVYGHPERRLARFPEILSTLDATVAGNPLVWRVTLTAFAAWWRWRAERRWSVVPRPEGRFEVQFDDWDPRYPLGLEIQRGAHISTIPIQGPRTLLRLEDLVYERRDVRIDLPSPRPAPWTPSLKAAVRSVLDWETVTPLEELPGNTWTARVKKGLRHWRSAKSREV